MRYVIAMGLGFLAGVGAYYLAISGGCTSGAALILDIVAAALVSFVALTVMDA